MTRRARMENEQPVQSERSERIRREFAQRWQEYVTPAEWAVVGDVVCRARQAGLDRAKAAAQLAITEMLANAELRRGGPPPLPPASGSAAEIAENPSKTSRK